MNLLSNMPDCQAFKKNPQGDDKPYDLADKHFATFLFSLRLCDLDLESVAILFVKTADNFEFLGNAELT